MARVVTYLLKGNGHAGMTVPMMAAGAEKCGDTVSNHADTDFRPEHLDRYDTAIFWGYVETLQNVMKFFSATPGKNAVYLDLAYWSRGTHYKVAVNARHPTAYFQNVKHDNKRRSSFTSEIKPWSFCPPEPKPWTEDGEHVLIAGLSQKAAWAEHEGPWGEYEEKAVAELRKYTQRPIIYRAKTSGSAKPIPGTRLSTLQEPLGPLLKRAWATVTRHSNVAVDGFLMGVPCFSWYGVGSVLSLQDVSKIEKPWRPEGRDQLFNDIGYCQWSIPEMQNGTVWRHLKDEGLIG